MDGVGALALGGGQVAKLGVTVGAVLIVGVAVAVGASSGAAELVGVGDWGWKGVRVGAPRQVTSWTVGEGFGVAETRGARVGGGGEMGRLHAVTASNASRRMMMEGR